jgi:flavin-dependent dehydrogenase
MKRKVIIIGAGPGGSTAALQLAKLGVKSTVIDKAVFPRDKVCGDGLSAKVVSLMQRVDSDMMLDFCRFDERKFAELGN